MRLQPSGPPQMGPLVRATNFENAVLVVRTMQQAGDTDLRLLGQMYEPKDDLLFNLKK